ncbi:MarR family winged helix-turn-helix transcriptional regulator [Sabulicella rubraurantiaca]|uniref:MarR family winged helix-turn-helix transcriptional regulator n=1 Tax=Sabulicella rubraurantiaca TaxID=2811429 RepID=UPI001A9690AA|nr:MarR family winged helix-turn-helix transcriptional regulator [Sabulicella rubraurantiaca]
MSEFHAGAGHEPPLDRPEGVRLGALDEQVGFTLRLAQEASFAAFARRTGEASLRPGRFAILVLIDANPGISQTELSAAAGRDKSTLTPALADLEGRGLVERRRVPKDRRSYALTLTDAGRKVLRTLSEHAAAHDRQLDALVGEENKAAFLATLRRIIAGLS